ncbi:hypothetical protein D3C78_1702920 [compost metagenome]
MGIKSQYSSGKVFFEHCHRMSFKFLFALTELEPGNAMENFCHGNSADCQIHRRLRVDPGQHLYIRLGPHEL